MRIEITSENEEIKNVLRAKQNSVRKDGNESVTITKKNKTLDKKGRITKAFNVGRVDFSVEDATQYTRTSVDVVKPVPKAIKLIYNRDNDNSLELVRGNDGDYNLIRRLEA